MGIKVVEQDYGFLCTCQINGNVIVKYYHGRGEHAFEHAFVKFSKYVRSIK